MSEVKELSAFEKKIAERRAREAAESAKRETEARVAMVEDKLASEWDDDLIPDLGGGKSGEEKDATGKALDALVSGIGIIEAYHRWCGKMRVDKRRRNAEGIKVSCPVPGHADANPSAWVNTDKNLWYCGRCGQGGDVYDLAAIHYGFPIPGYKDGGQFHELRKKIAESYGYTFHTAPGLDKPILVAPEVAKKVERPTPIIGKKGDPDYLKPIGERSVDKDEEDTGGTVTAISPELEPDADPILDRPGFDWRTVVAPGSFLDAYMECCRHDDVPEEYHFWNGMLALSMTAGRDVTLEDQKPVLANFFLCLTGPTGDGKSRSFSHLTELLYTALPYRSEDPTGKGVDMIKSPASAEMLISMFVNPIADPTDAKKIAGFAPVRGIIEFNELASLVGRAGRKGSVLKPTLMEFYDGARVIATSSLTHGKSRAENAYASMFTTAQPKALKDLIREGDASSGFLNRIIFASGTPKKRIGVGGKKIDIAPSIPPLKAVQGWIGFGRMVTWTDGTAALFNKHFEESLVPIQQGDDSGLLDRIDLLVKKLILLLCLNEKQKEVTEAVIEKAISMVPYIIASYGVPAAFIGSNVNTEVQEELTRHITRLSKTKGGVSMRDLMKLIARKKFPLDVVTKTIKYLTELGFIEAFTTTGVGRPTVKYRMTAD